MGVISGITIWRISAFGKRLTIDIIGKKYTYLIHAYIAF